MSKNAIQGIFKVNNLSDEEYKKRYVFMEKILNNEPERVNNSLISEIYSLEQYNNPRWEYLYQRYLETGYCSYCVNLEKLNISLS